MQKAKSVFLVLKNALLRRWKLVAIILVILLIGFFIVNRNKNKNADELTFEKPQIEDIIKTIDVSGVVDAKEKARLRFIAGGKVTYLGAQEGEEVKKWQTIASIDQATLKKQLEQDLNAYMKERWDFEQSKDDYGNYDLLPLDDRRVRDKEQWDLENEVLDVEIKDIAIKNTAIYAPFDGILTVSPTRVTGIQLLATDYFEVVNPNTLIFRATVDEADISKIKDGQEVEIELDAYPDEIFTSYVNYIAYTSSQTSSGTVFIVEFPLSQELANKFRIGMNGDVSIKVDSREQVMTIPFDATKEKDDKYYVDVKTGDKTYEEREIQIDLETDDKVEVTSGLSIDDQVLIPE